MGNKIAVDPDRLQGLADSMVGGISAIQDNYKDLHKRLALLVLNAPAEYRHCFNNVGDPWNTGGRLVEGLNEMEIKVRQTADKFDEADNYVAKLYNLYDKYGTMTAMGATAGRQGLYYAMGATQFIKDSNGAYTFKHAGLLSYLSDIVDNSKARNFVRGRLSVFNLRKKFVNTPLEDLVHKKFARYLPNDVLDLVNATQTFDDAINLGGLKSANFGSVIKSAAKFGRVNAVFTVGTTFAVEMGGMGLKISQNYSKYSRQPEILKRENAKAVGNALNKTAAVSTGAIIGGVIGGVAGSFLGPVGTVIAAGVGSTIGGFIGEQAAKLTAGFAEKLALKAKEPIHKTLETIKGGLKKVGKVADAVSKGTDLINDGIKGIFKSPKALFNP
ncbi:WXG100 family type VII secretion target [Mesobacillus zeae]|uniref:WXG100 family type VII secretion target n=1 Tax=Mesobacillus zeae TaxID=1917180 RepID=A0A398BBE2_9BACI|nr:WXG100 family type VII secretion target [Mesobacillus zeae]RID86761.1 WXG100 family type VII secretion target [Mesobacillus zeae]